MAISCVEKLFAQVIEVTEDRDESVNIQLGNNLHGLMYQCVNDLGSCKVKIEINITKTDV